jgi:hypothetical protein
MAKSSKLILNRELIAIDEDEDLCSSEEDLDSLSAQKGAALESYDFKLSGPIIVADD